MDSFSAPEVLSEAAPVPMVTSPVLALSAEVSDNIPLAPSMLEPLDRITEPPS